MQNNLSSPTQWSDCLNYLSHRVKEQTFKTWLKPTKGEPGSNGDFKIIVPNQFVADWIRDHFNELIEEALFEVSGNKYELQFIINQQEEPHTQPSLALYESLRKRFRPLPATPEVLI